MLVEVDLTRQTIHAVEHSQARLTETGPPLHNGIPREYLTKATNHVTFRGNPIQVRIWRGQPLKFALTVVAIRSVSCGRVL
jgi:hypothetical protein